MLVSYHNTRRRQNPEELNVQDNINAFKIYTGRVMGNRALLRATYRPPSSGGEGNIPTDLEEKCYEEQE